MICGSENGAQSQKWQSFVDFLAPTQNRFIVRECAQIGIVDGQWENNWF